MMAAETSSRNAPAWISFNLASAALFGWCPQNPHAARNSQLLHCSGQPNKRGDGGGSYRDYGRNRVRYRAVRRTLRRTPPDSLLPGPSLPRTTRPVHMHVDQWQTRASRGRTGESHEQNALFVSRLRDGCEYPSSASVAKLRPWSIASRDDAASSTERIRHPYAMICSVIGSARALLLKKPFVREDVHYYCPSPLRHHHSHHHSTIATPPRPAIRN